MGLIKKTAIGASAAAVISLAVAGIMPDEGYFEMPYRDIVGVWTDCHGETKGVVPGVARGRAKCDALLVKRVTEDYYTPLTQCIPGFTGFALPTQSATVRLSYNIGVGATCSGSVGRLMSAGHVKEGCNAFLLYNKARVKGKLQAVRGLTLRRERERAQCLQGA